MYGDGTEGWERGSDTSEERARADLDDGSAEARRDRALLYLRTVAGSHGITADELSNMTGAHRGKTSSTLTTLHRLGEVSRVARKRGRSHLYVLPQHLRPDDVVQPYVPRRSEADRKIADLEDRIARARTAVLTGENSTFVLRILEGRA